MRLIDADAFIKMMEERCDHTASLDELVLKVCRGGIKKMPTINPEPQWILCCETADLPDHEVLCCDLRGNMLIGYLYTDESSDTGFGAESDGECLVDCVVWREKPEPWKEGE